MVSKMKKRCNQISNIFAAIILVLIFESIIVNLSIGYGLMYSVTNTSIERDFWGLESILYPIRNYAQKLIFFSGPIAVLVITLRSCIGKDEPHLQYWALLKIAMSYIVPFVLCIPAYYVSVHYNFGNPSYYFYPYILFGFLPTCVCVVISMPVVLLVKYIKREIKTSTKEQP